MSTLIYWFRNDLRLQDNLALSNALAGARQWIPVYVDEDATARTTRWGFARVSAHRRRFLHETLEALDASLRALGSRLIVLQGAPRDVLPALAREVGADRIACESIPAPQELAEVEALRGFGLTVDTTLQSTLLPVGRLPFAIDATPDVFTAFRQRVERAEIRPLAPVAAPAWLPSSVATPMPARTPADEPAQALTDARPFLAPNTPQAAQTWHPAPETAAANAHPHGGERAAQAHLRRYFSQSFALTYKTTRDAVDGTDHSTRFSPWLAIGALSARQVHAALRDFESREGANESTYWIWFELLWRDHFRLLHLKHGSRLYHPRGLRSVDPPQTRTAGRGARGMHSSEAAQRFHAWTEGRTGEPIVDAGMRELRATGWLSNRMRQIAASFLVNDLGCDWRAGAAWFESQLVDFDVFSNQGNWLYIAGLGTDPRGGRRFDPVKQASLHDPHGTYRLKWGCT